MRRAHASTRLPGRISEAEALWYDRSRWPAFVDGFAAVRSVEGEPPQAGSVVVWDSHPGGRGRVLERVTSYEPRSGQVLEVEDAQLRGTQTVGFAARGDDEVEMVLELTYELKQGGPFMALTDVVFIRRALRDSLARTLDRFAAELAGDRALAAEGGGYPPDLSRIDHR